MKRRHMFRRRFFFACGWRPGLHQWTMAGRVRGEKMHVRGARLALTMRCLGAAGGKRTEREDGEPAKSSRGGVRPQHNSEGPSGHWNDTVPGRFRPFATYIWSRQQKRMRAVSVRRIPTPAAEAAVEEEAEASGESRAKPTWAGQAAPAPEGGQAELRQIIYGREKY